MHKRVLGVLGVVGLAVTLTIGLNLEPGGGTASETPEPAPGTSRATGRGRAVPLRAPTPPPSGPLRIRGVVRTDEGPVAGVHVSATRATPEETLSELPCPKPLEASKQDPSRRDARLPDCMGEAEGLVLEWVSARHGEAPVYAEATTAADGSFVLEGLPEGEFRVWALGGQGAVQRQGVAAGTEGLELVLDEGTTVEGTVLDEEGAPLPEVRLTLLHEGHTRFFDALSGEDGRFRIGPLPRDSYALVAEKDGWLPMVQSAGLREWLKGRVVLARPRRLVGQVLSDGAAAAGAEVWLGGLERRGLPEQQTVADAEGRFVFDGLAPEDYRLMATLGERHAVERAELSTPRKTQQEVVLQLGSGFLAEGTVRDEAQRPVEGVHVSVRPEGEYEQSWNAVTGVDGHYKVGPLQAGSYEFSLSAPRYLDRESLERELTRDTGPVDFTLTSGVQISGVLVDEAGRPVPDIRLYLMATPEVEDELSPPRDYGFSEADGRFALDAPKAGNWTLDISDEGFLAKTQGVEAPAEHVRVVLSRGATVTGTVTDTRGAPVERSWVVLWHAESEGRSERAEATDAQGHFTLRGVKPGRYMLEATLETPGVDRTAVQALEVRGTERVEVALRFEEGRTLPGLVVDDEGQPVEGVSVRVNRTGESIPAWRRESRSCGNRTTRDARTDAEGRFTLRHLEAATYWLYAYKEGYTFKASRAVGGELVGDYSLQVNEATKELRLVLERQGRVLGRLVGPDGAPLRHFSLNDQLVSDREGRFEDPFESSGKVRLELSAPGMAPVLRVVEVREGVDLDLGDIPMDSGRRVTGRVLDAETGAPVAEAKIQVTEERADAQEPFLATSLQAVTREDGTFELPQVEARPLALQVSREDYLEGGTLLGASTEAVTVALEPGAQVEVTLVDREGRPMSGYVSLDREDTSGWESLTVREGTLVRRGVPPGVYTARAHPSEPEGAGIFLPQRVQVPARGKVVLRFAERREGVTLKLRLGEEDELMEAIVFPGTPPGPAAMLTLSQWRSGGLHGEREEGRVAFRYLPEGRATLLLVSASSPLRYYTEELELPSTGEVERAVQAGWRPLPAE